MSQLNWWKTACAVCVLCAVTAIALTAQTLTTLHTFDGTDGEIPYTALVQAANGNLYGTTEVGGARGLGTAFEITPSGTFTLLYSFCSQSDCTDGSNPSALVQASNGDFYGTTAYGGASDNCESAHNGCGTIFKITPSGTLTTLYSFCLQIGCADGEYPSAGLVQATDGNLYGTTYAGGAKLYGTVFRVSPSGMLTTLYSFCSETGCRDGRTPLGGLTEATNGDFYGTTQYGGADSSCLDSNHGCGTIFRISPSGTLTSLYSFCSRSNCVDGGLPEGALLQATNGNFYGTTFGGGANGNDGTVFKISPTGTLTTLYSFCSQSNCTDGLWPNAALVQGTDGNFYGTTTFGGVVSGFCHSLATGCGTLFKIIPNGALTTLYAFCSQSGCRDGSGPGAALVQDTDGGFYGTTEGGGTEYGTVFSLSVGLGPFVETQPTSGVAGRLVKVLGTDLTGATGVTFNGTAAAFTIVSPSLITTTVPAGATTGTVQVVTPGGTLSSNVPFRVIE